MKWSLADWWFILRSAHLLGLVSFLELIISWVSMTVGVFLFF